METVRGLDFLRSAPLFRHLSDEKLAWNQEHIEEVNLESGAMIARQGGPADGFEVRLPADGHCGQELLASRDLRAGAST